MTKKIHQYMNTHIITIVLIFKNTHIIKISLHKYFCLINNYKFFTS